MSDTKLNRALLAWFHEHGGPDNPVTAHHVLHWSGAAALTVCTSEADYQAVATAMEVAMMFLTEAKIFNVRLTSAATARGITEGKAAELMVNTPTDYTVEFNRQHVYLWKDSELLADAEIE